MSIYCLNLPSHRMASNSTLTSGASRMSSGNCDTAQIDARSVVLATVFAILCLWKNPVSSAEYTIHAGPNGYAPFFVVQRNGENVEYSGLINDLLDVFEARNPEYRRNPILLTRKRANKRMANGEVFDVMFNSPLFVSDEILDHYTFTQTLLTSSDVVITRKDQNFEYREPKDLFNKTVATIRGYGYGDFDRLLEAGTIQGLRVDQHPQAIGMLARKRVEAYFGNIYVSPYYIKEMGLEISDFTFSEVSMYEFDFAFAVNNNKPKLYKKLNEFVGDVVASGVLDDLIKRYSE